MKKKFGILAKNAPQFGGYLGGYFFKKNDGGS